MFISKSLAGTCTASDLLSIGTRQSLKISSPMKQFVPTVRRIAFPIVSIIAIKATANWHSKGPVWKMHPLALDSSRCIVAVNSSFKGSVVVALDGRDRTTFRSGFNIFDTKELFSTPSANCHQRYTDYCNPSSNLEKGSRKALSLLRLLPLGCRYGLYHPKEEGYVLALCD